VAAVGLLYATVRRTSGHLAGLLAGAALALTPVAVLMFRFDNPDALLVFLLVFGAYCVVRAVERASVWWLMLAGSAVGFAFLTKMLQAFLVLPAFGLVYLLAAPVGLGRRIAHLAAALGALIVSAGWFVALVALWPAASRPYIAGSTNNSVLELAFGYNGLSRIFGGNGSGGGAGGGPPGGVAPSGFVPGGGGFGGGNTAFGGSSGLLRMFGASFGAEISWLLPAALIAMVAGLWFTRRAPRTDRVRVALLLWGGWLVVTALVFSLMSGITHPYYAVALAPPIAGLVAIGGRELWLGRSEPAARTALGAMIAVTGGWSFILLDRTASWLPALRWAVLVLGILVAAALIVGLPTLRKGTAVLAVVAVLTTGAATAAYGLSTASRPHTGSIPVSGPVSDTAFGGARGGPGGAPGGPGAGPDGAVANGQLAGLLAGTATTWAAATTGATAAASLELASGKAVIAIGGWNGGDPAPTLAQFQQWVRDGKIAYYVSGGGFGGRGNGGFGGPGVGPAVGPGGGPADGRAASSGDIADWVAANYTATTVGNQTVYDLRR
jgi:4-amino-4-deoxy-L-arabinose transferase-like glycosyltransferase